MYWQTNNYNKHKYTQDNAATKNTELLIPLQWQGLTQTASEMEQYFCNEQSSNHVPDLHVVARTNKLQQF